MARQERHQPSGCIMSLRDMPWGQTRRVSLRWQTGESGSRFDPGSSKFSTKLELPQPARVAETATVLALRRRWLILGVVLVGSFMAILDVFIVTQGLPSIKTSLGAGVADLELVVSAYSLVYAVFLITGGRLGDILDRKRIFLSGMTVFTVASALAGYAPSAAVLIGARALQGLGAALMYPQVLSIIQVTFKGSERSLALGLFAATSGIGAITGNIVGGLLIQLNLAGLSWRPIFLVNVPVGIIGVLAGFLVLHPYRTALPPKLDLPAVGLISLFLVSLVLPLAEGQQTGWPNWMIMLLIYLSQCSPSSSFTAQRGQTEQKTHLSIWTSSSIDLSRSAYH